MSTIGEEQASALAALKSSDELISDSLQKELEATRKQLNQKSFEHDELKEQFMGALLSKDKIQKRLDDALAGGSTNGRSTPVPATPGDAQKAEKTEKLKAALRQKIEVSSMGGYDRFDRRCDIPYSPLGLPHAPSVLSEVPLGRSPASSWRSRSPKRRRSGFFDGVFWRFKP